jgi:hypothetical protein
VSRGLGRCERDVLALLNTYRRLGDCGMQRWSAEGSFYRELYVKDDDFVVRLFETGHIVEVRRIRRETGYSAAVLSRTLRSLERKELVALLDAAFEERHSSFRTCRCPAVKFVGLREAGLVSANKSKETKLALTPMPAWEPTG